MEYRRLGQAGIALSALGFGTWITFGDQLDVKAAKSCMSKALELGVNFFDTAESYADGVAESITGQVLAGVRREDIVVATKLFWGGEGPNRTGLSRKHLIEGIDGSLKRLGLEYVDLLFCHRPDPETPIEETVLAMDSIIRSGKALYWGTSEWSAASIREAIHLSREYRTIPPVVEQPQYSILVRERLEREYVPLFDEFGIGATTWSPLASGLLTGKYASGVPEASRLGNQRWLRDMYTKNDFLGREISGKISRLTALAAEIDCTPAQLALAWCLRNPRVSSVITGASRIEQIEENLAAVEAVDRLEDEVVDRIDEIFDNRPAQNEYNTTRPS